MIISASYRTDIPAFYGEWFLGRLAAGFAQTRNPYSGEIATIPLDPDSVDGFVFWTRNAGPFFAALDQVHDRGHPFVVQYTVTGYPRELEWATIAPERAAEHIHRIADRYGPLSVVWRYDPMVFSSLTPAAWHEDNFARLAQAMKGAVNEAVVSFAQIYKKTARNLAAAARAFDFTWTDPPAEDKTALLKTLAAIAADHGLRLALCAQPDLMIPAVATARCIDAARLARIGGRPFPARAKPHRPDCDCFEARDIGDYDSCPHGCTYCYAVRHRAAAKDNFRRHDPAGPSLISSRP